MSESSKIYETYPYTVREVNHDGKSYYLATFKDGGGKKKEAEISESQFAELVRLTKEAANVARKDRDHKGNQILGEEEIAELGGLYAPSAEDVALNNLLIAELRAALLLLPPVQARRYLLAHALGFTYKEIARMDGCSRNAVKHSLVHARKNLQIILENRLPASPSKSPYLIEGRFLSEEL